MIDLFEGILREFADAARGIRDTEHHHVMGTTFATSKPGEGTRARGDRVERERINARKRALRNSDIGATRAAARALSRNVNRDPARSARAKAKKNARNLRYRHKSRVTA